MTTRAWHNVELARHPDRRTLDYIREMMTASSSCMATALRR